MEKLLDAPNSGTSFKYVGMVREDKVPEIRSSIESQVYEKWEARPGNSYSFPTCQVRVVRFYQSACPPPLPPPRLRLFHLHFRLANLANSSPSSSPTSQLSVHHWTSTWDLPSSVCTAGPQPGTCPLSVHRWTSTWDLPSSVCTAGPQPGTCPPLDLNGQVECQKRCQIECQKIRRYAR